MPPQGILLKIYVVDEKGHYLGGAVDLEVMHRRRRDRVVYRADASGEIRVRGLQRRRARGYKVTITPAIGLPPQSQFVRVPPGGIAALQFVFPTRGLGKALAGNSAYIVSGRVSSPQSASVVGLRVQIVDRNVGQDVPLTETITDDRGHYEARFTAKPTDRGKTQFDFQARVFSKETFVGASEVRYNAATEETLNIILPAGSAGLATEHEALIGAVSKNVTGPLRDLQETNQRADISYLANKTGWDARAVAMAALADRFSQIGGGAAAGGIPSPLYYALFRAGLPANPDTLFQLGTDTVKRVWKEALEKGVIPREVEAELPRATQLFEAISADKLLTTAAPAAVSPMKDLLQTGRLDQEQQQKFASLYVANRTNLTAFWDSVKEQFGGDVADRLQVSGKLAFLTLNNAPLMQQIQRIGGDAGIKDPVQLASAGFHRASRWQQVLSPTIPIPDTIPGDTAEQQQANYASYLAAQIRLSYPTAAVAEMVQAGDLKVGAPEAVHAFLTENHGQFEIGAQPVEQYIFRKSLEVPVETVQAIKHLQRLYQITPSDEAMFALLNRGIDSAYRVVQYGKEAFIRDFGNDLGGPEQARQTYDKSAHVHNAVLNVAISYLTAKNGIVLGAQPLAEDGAIRQAESGGGQIVQPGPTPGVGDVIAYPTLEGLFGSMDFCACDHCRSILSPAAYLVDLLNFVDQPAPPTGTENPQAVLLERRPDLEHLPLTCENTNTALPYIDVVNETLEYFISNDVNQLSLTGYVGHDTADASSADLLASPAFVTENAYSTLLSQRFPAPLPFHKSLEELRRYFEKFEVPLPLAMERFRVKNTLERNGTPYGWRDILMEEAGLSRADYRIFTDFAGVPLGRMYGFPNGTPDADVIAKLSNARDFARRLDISYEDLVKILGTRSVNPDSNLIPKAARLGVSFGVLNALKNGTITPAEFDALLPTGAGALNPADYGGDIKAWVTDDDNFARLMGLIVLTDPTGSADPCNFGDLELRHARPMTDASDTSTRLTVAEFVRILRLIRLWKKTGWTIDQTDDAVCALFNADLSPVLELDTVEKLDAGFLRLLPRLGIVLRVMKALNLNVERDLRSVLALWGQIGTHGSNALYRQMFLNPALLEQDAAFGDNGFGEFLQDGTEKLLAHAEALRSAFNLTGEEIDRIVAALGFDANTPLDIASISAIYRRGWLARRLPISIQEFLLLMQLTGLDPFAPPNPTNPAVLRLASLAKTLKEQGLKSAAALYLIWNQDLSGRSAPDPAQVGELVRTLRADFAAIDDQFAVVDDPTGDIVRARMSLVYGPEATTTFLALIDDTLELDVPYTNPQTALKPSITNADPRIAYDAFRHRLSYTGVFTAQRRQTLRTLPSVPAVFKVAVDALFDRSEDIIGSFFARYPELKPLYDAYIASPDPPDVKRRKLLAGFRPELSSRRKRQQALQRLSAAVGLELAFTRTLLDPPAPPFPLHAAGRPNRPALNDIVALQTQGLGAQFFFRNTATGTVDVEVPAEGNLSYSPTGNNPLPVNPPPGTAISGIWRGMVEAPETGFFNIVIEADTTANATLSLGGQDRPLTQNGTIWRNTDPMALTAGTLYEIVATVQRVREVVSIKWETQARSREVIPARYCYPPGVLGPFSDAYTRFVKAASLATGLRTTANEIAHFATHADYDIGGDEWLNVLSVSGNPDPPTAAALLKPLEALLDFSRIKAEVSPDDESLLTILRDPAAATTTPESLLFTLTRWDPTSLQDVVTHFLRTIADLGSFEFFRRVYDAFALARLMGIAGGAMIAATTNDPASDTVRNLQGALRARYEPDDWRDVVQPINDTLRGRRRDALVAYVLHHMRSRPAKAHINTPEKLFEYFLMDVQMEPCMQTSRIRHALSSVQLFIERCLMNLEPRVSPAALNAKQWEWMKRYRVWEANRKVFLFPENWLEPELRDDKSSFFKDIEGELLQGEITEDTAVIAILNYLEKLEGVAKLQPVGIHHIWGDPALRTGDIDHVVAATTGSRRKYFYRRREFGYWTPWEPIKLDIEDTPVIPVVWDDRLLLFWLQVMKKTPQKSARSAAGKDLIDLKTDDVPADPSVTTQAILGWSEYYNGRWQTPKTSDVELPSDIFSSAEAFLRRHLSLSVSDKNEWLHVGINYLSSERTSFILYNTHASPVRLLEQTPEESASLFEFVPVRYIHPSDTYSDSLLEAYYLTPNTGAVISSPYSYVYHTILEPKVPIKAVTTLHRLNTKPFEIPFFVDDRRHAFFVATKHELQWVGNYFDFGVTYNPGLKVEVSIPPVVAKPEFVPPKPEFWGGGGPIGPDPGVVNPAGIQEFVTQDAYIQQGLGTSGPVIYGGKQIGPSGAFADVPVIGLGTRGAKKEGPKR